MNPATEETTSAPTADCTSPMSHPKPAPEHHWLKRFVGEWESEMEMKFSPDQPVTRAKGVDRARMLGEFWMISEGTNSEMDYTCQFMVGYDPHKQKFIGGWIDSMTSSFWQYEGTLDAQQRVLTLYTEGTMPDGSHMKFKEVTEFISYDHRVFTSAWQDASGEWKVHLTIHFRRKS